MLFGVFPDSGGFSAMLDCAPGYSRAPARATDESRCGNTMQTNATRASCQARSLSRLVSPARPPSSRSSKRIAFYGRCCCVDSLPDVLEPADPEVEEKRAAGGRAFHDRTPATIPVRGMRLAVFPVVDYEWSAWAAKRSTPWMTGDDERTFRARVLASLHFARKPFLRLHVRLRIG